MRQPFICLLIVSLLLTFFQINDCFRLFNVTQTGVVYENETLSESLLPTAASSSADNRTQMMMIVANEISNLPRFDPKNGGLMMSRQVASSTDATMAGDAVTTSESPFPSPSSSSSTSQLHQPADPEDVTTLRNASNSQSNDPFDSCQFCPEARFLQHYFSKGCIAMQLQSECQPKFCPKFFECPAEKELPKDACLYEGKSYSFGESVPHRDPCQHCVCINSTSGPMMSCAISECFNSWTALQPNCYRKYTEGKCCPEIVCVPENQSLSTCEHEGNIYNFGDYFSPEGDPCHNCLCDERWNRSSSNNNSSKQLLDTVCTRLECHFDFDRPENRGCVPVYSEKACCPMYFHCPPDESTKPKCKFGGNFYEVGEQVKVKQHEVCLECSCLVPPEISCKHKACPTVPTNCTAHYVEGECCPQFKCDTAAVMVVGGGGVAEGNFDEEGGLEKSLSPAKEERDSDAPNQNCPPVENCREPCKVVQVDHHRQFAGDDADLEANEQSEGVRCARCQCLLQETLVPTENHINSAAASAVPVSEEEEEEREQWGKSIRSPPSPASAASRCPPVDCHHPCYIYRVASGDCPRCLCLPKKTEQF